MTEPENQAEALDEKALGAAAIEFERHHRNSCYPECLDVESDIAAKAIVSAYIASLPEAPAVPVVKAREEIIVDISEELKHHDAFDGAAVSQLVWAARIYDKVIAPLLPPQEGAAE